MYHLFDVVGLELEYMIVDDETLHVKPITDRVLHTIAGDYLTEVECGEISYSNELALHVIELKTTRPEKTLFGLDRKFQEHVTKINSLLQPYKAKLLPTACHPWMDPMTEMRLWPHEHNPIYEAYDRIFDCRGHGWANLQSAHINLPFSGDSEFYRLHSAIRMLLPLLPALAASSPIMEGKVSDKLDKRLDVYRYNQKNFPVITGDVVPEAVQSRDEYEERILKPMYQAIRPHDPQSILQYEWLNSRGAIARFDRDAIEIRVLDIQECPAADVAIASAIIRTLQNLIEERWRPFQDWCRFPTQALSEIFFRSVEAGDMAVIENEDYLRIFHLDRPLSARDLWRYLLTDVLAASESEPLELILREGPLARRILRSYEREPSPFHLRDVYRKLAQCLGAGELFQW